MYSKDSFTHNLPHVACRRLRARGSQQLLSVCHSPTQFVVRVDCLLLVGRTHSATCCWQTGCTVSLSERENRLHWNNCAYRPGRPLPVGQPGQSKQLPPPPPIHKNLQNKNCEALQYCDSNEFIELTVGTSRVLMSKAATNNICSN
jgi:hypothetical protein